MSKIGIIDTGIGTDKKCHPDINVVERYNFTPDKTNIMSHGLHVAGIAGAIENGRWITGIYPGVPVVDLRFFDNEEKTHVKLAECIEKAIEVGCTAINMSLSTIAYSDNDKAIKKAADANILMFAAAMNNGKNILPFPANHEDVISIGSTDSEGNISEFSNYLNVDFYTYGEDIKSLSRFESIPGDQEHLLSLSGTSQADPRVTAFAEKWRDATLEELGTKPNKEETIEYLKSVAEKRYDEKRNKYYYFLDIKVIKKEWELVESEEMDTAPFIKDSRTFVPLRFIAEALGAEVDYKDGEIEIFQNDRKIEIEIGSKELKIYK